MHLGKDINFANSTQQNISKMRFLQSDFDLTTHNTFNIKAKALYYFEPHNLEDIVDFFDLDLPALERHNARPLHLLVIGGGSNLLFTKDFDGVVVCPLIKGIDVVAEDEDSVYIKAAAGEVWDEFVEWCVESGYAGLENLSHIPGSVGASPVQNIGAYGVEAMDLIEEVELFVISQRKTIKLKNNECKFAYRDSIFKHEFKDDFIVTSVTYRLSKKANSKLSYADLKQRFGDQEQVGISEIRKTVIEIRKQKLPDPDEIGSAGSFFKNPIVNQSKFLELQKAYPQMPFYRLDENTVKIPAGWMIDQCGLKGYRKGDAGVHDKQALVLVNHGAASGQEIAELAIMVKEKVAARFGVEIEPEVNWI